MFIFLFYTGSKRIFELSGFECFDKAKYNNKYLKKTLIALRNYVFLCPPKTSLSTPVILLITAHLNVDF